MCGTKKKKKVGRGIRKLTGKVVVCGRGSEEEKKKGSDGTGENMKQGGRDRKRGQRDR